MKELPSLEDDGLHTPSVKAHAEEKYKLIKYSSSIFATAMKDKWDVRVYIDLFAGAGKARIEGKSKIVAASPLLTLDIPNKFDKYIFCEEDPKCMHALQIRVEKDYADANVDFIQGDSNITVNELISKIPSYSKGHTVLSFCFVDIFRMNNLSFSTIECLSKLFMDFLILIPIGMDIKRGEHQYFLDTDTTIMSFTGNKNWRDKWLLAKKRGVDFGDFVENQFIESMSRLGFGKPEFKQIKNIKNRVIYHLMYFSKSERGMKLFEDSKKYSTQQEKLF